MTREREYFFGEDKMMANRGGFGGRGGMGGGRGFVHKSQIVKALKETMQTGHRTGLPPKILDYFNARPAPPVVTDMKKQKKRVPFTGLAAYVSQFAGPQDPEEVKDSGKTRLFKNPELTLQCRLDTETRTEKQLRLREWQKEEAIRAVQEAAKSWDPHNDPKADGDPFRTLFVGRLSFEVTEKKLKREFEEFGPVKRVRIVTDKAGKSRGYAFVEFEDKKDMKEAYKAADGRKIEGRRVVVDVERGRTVESWKPRRLGGGLGGEGRLPKAPKKPGKNTLPMLPGPPISDFGVDRRGGPRERSPPPRDVRMMDRDRERIDRERLDRERGDRDRERERSKREREPSPRRDRERPDDVKRRREVEEGEVRRDRERDRR